MRHAGRLTRTSNAFEMVAGSRIDTVRLEAISNRRFWLTVAIAAGISVALSVATTLLLHPPRTATGSGAAVADPGRSARRALTRLDDLEARLAELEAPLSSRDTGADGVRPAERRVVGDDGQELTVHSLARRLAALERGSASRGQTTAATQGGNPELTPAERARIELLIKESERVITDPTASVADKLAAHERLRFLPATFDGYTDEMARELIRIGLAETDARVRANVWRIFHGSSTAKLQKHLLQPLMRAAATDPDADVRAEACETLGNFKRDPSVLAALRWSARHDQDKFVRFKARRSLGLGPE